MTEPERKDQQQGKDAREAALYSVISNTVGLLFQLGIIVVVIKRDWLKRQYLRYRWHVLQEWRGAHERRLLAELRTDISRIEHDDA